MVNVTIDGRSISVPEHTTILEAAREAGIHIPTLCYLKELNEIGACRVCVVEIDGIDQLVAACNNYVLDGMVVRTATPKVLEARKTNVEFILTQHDSQCTSCGRSGNCNLQSVANDLGVLGLPYEKHLPGLPWDLSFPLIRNNDKCINCLRCLQVCDKVQASYVWDLGNRASHTNVNVAGGAPIRESSCALCGQCITHCPTAALRERDDTDAVWQALADPEVVTIVQIAPSVRTAWGDPWGLTGDEATVERLVSALRPLGFDYIINTDFSADLTIMEEGSELLHRLSEGGDVAWPMFTSCCPGWVRFIKEHYPQLVDQVSTSKSPQQMFGAVVKSYYAEQLGVDPHKIFSVSIMPCLAKKHECALPSMRDACGDPDVDVVLTVREMDRMIRRAGVDVHALEDGAFDEPLGVGTGAGIIFGATGGVMEAALRTASYLATGSAPEEDVFADVRGLDGWKEATYDLGGTKLRVAVASGLGNAAKLCDALLAGEVAYDFVEVMACPGGCVGGGGQPIHDGMERQYELGQVLYGLDKVATYRNSYENPSIVKVYDEFFGEPLSERAEKLLHTDQHAWMMPAEQRAAVAAVETEL
ncbi:MAG: (2Fe-2S)-binding protein [Atopobiaceae bacterium]|nr:(2Fe-2S)-binding protein [Atopobiaceae bacterium]